MAKRLTRAKNKIRDSGLALAMPRAELLQTRTADVLKVRQSIASGERLGAPRWTTHALAVVPPMSNAMACATSLGLPARSPRRAPAS